MSHYTYLYHPPTAPTTPTLAHPTAYSTLRTAVELYILVRQTHGKTCIRWHSHYAAVDCGRVTVPSDTVQFPMHMFAGPRDRTAGNSDRETALAVRRYHTQRGTHLAAPCMYDT